MFKGGNISIYQEAWRRLLVDWKYSGYGQMIITSFTTTFPDLGDVPMKKVVAGMFDSQVVNDFSDFAGWQQMFLPVKILDFLQAFKR